jgi:protein subunit release factor A
LHKLDRVIDGDLDDLVGAVIAWHQAERLKGDEPQL